MQKQIPNALEDKDALINNLHVETCPVKDDSIGKTSCHDSLVEINANTDSTFAAEEPPALIRSNIKKKRRRKNKSSNAGAPLGRKLLILNLNGLLVDIVPCHKYQPEPDIVVSGSRCKLLFCWDLSNCTDLGHKTLEDSSKPLVLKKLEKLWEKLNGDYDASNTLLIDDSPYKALHNPVNTAIFPYSYEYKNAEDCSLGPGGDLRVYLEKLAEDPNIQSYVVRFPFGKGAIGRNDPNWEFYRYVKKGPCRKSKPRWKKARRVDPSTEK